MRARAPFRPCQSIAADLRRFSVRPPAPGRADHLSSSRARDPVSSPISDSSPRGGPGVPEETRYASDLRMRHCEEPQATRQSSAAVDVAKVGACPRCGLDRRDPWGLAMTAGVACRWSFLKTARCIQINGLCKVFLVRRFWRPQSIPARRDRQPLDIQAQPRSERLRSNSSCPL